MLYPNVLIKQIFQSFGLSVSVFSTFSALLVPSFNYFLENYCVVNSDINITIAEHSLLVDLFIIKMNTQQHRISTKMNETGYRPRYVIQCSIGLIKKLHPYGGYCYCCIVAQSRVGKLGRLRVLPTRICNHKNFYHGYIYRVILL